MNTFSKIVVWLLFLCMVGFIKVCSFADRKAKSKEYEAQYIRGEFDDGNYKLSQIDKDLNRMAYDFNKKCPIEMDQMKLTRLEYSVSPVSEMKYIFVVDQNFSVNSDINQKEEEMIQQFKKNTQMDLLKKNKITLRYLYLKERIDKSHGDNDTICDFKITPKDYQ